MFELSGVNYEEVLEQEDSILIRVIARSSYRGFELSGLYCICICFCLRLLVVLFIVYNFDTFYIEFYIVFSMVLISLFYAIHQE